MFPLWVRTNYKANYCSFLLCLIYLWFFFLGLCFDGYFKTSLTSFVEVKIKDFDNDFCGYTCLQ